MQNPERAIAAIEAIRADIAPVITPDLAAKALGCDPASIRLQAKENPAMLGFPVCWTGSTTMIPRKPFLLWLTGE